MDEGHHPVVLSPIRATIARRMVQSKQQAPHFYVATDIEMDAVVQAVDRLNEGRERGRQVTLTAFIVRATALTLAEHPAFNALWRGNTLELIDAINVGVAIRLDDGLIAPALLNCGELDVEAVSTSLRSLVVRSRAGKIRARELSDATFTVSNLGMFDVSAFTAIVSPPQVSILATARAEPRAVVRDGVVVSRQMMTATLSSDHRAVDGAAAAAFLGDVKRRIQQPDGWPSGNGAVR